MNKKIVKRLQQLGKEIPESLMKNLHKEQLVAPDVKRVWEMAKKSKDISADRKAELQDIEDTGIIDRKEVVVDQKVARKIEKWMEKRIQEEVKLGNLPDPKEYIGKYMKKIWKKSELKKISSKTKSKK